MSRAVSARAGLRRLTARSVVLSALLGTHPPSARGSEIIALSAAAGINESAVRVALTRLVGTGDLVRADGRYRLSDRLVARQIRQDATFVPPSRDWRHRWRMAVVVSVGNEARTRATLRGDLRALRFAELREGVWMRPDNIDVDWPPSTFGLIETFMVTHEGNAAGLATTLFDTRGWAATGHGLLDMLPAAQSLDERFTIVAAIVRHLVVDPLLPAELLPATWPGAALREAYDTFREELFALRRSVLSD